MALAVDNVSPAALPAAAADADPAYGEERFSAPAAPLVERGVIDVSDPANPQHVATIGAGTGRSTGDLLAVGIQD